MNDYDKNKMGYYAAEHRRAISEGRRRLVEAIDKNAKKVIKAKEAMENALNSKKV